MDDRRNRREEARDARRTAQPKHKKYFNQKCKEKTFKPGDLVLLKYNRFGPGYKAPSPHFQKLGPLSTPLHVLERLSPISYRLDLPPNSHIHVIHLKEFKGEGKDIRPLPVVLEDHEEWEVQSIDGERSRKGTTEYLVRWKGYGKHERTWEPLAHLEHAQELLRWRESRPDNTRTIAPKRKSTTTPARESNDDNRDNASIGTGQKSLMRYCHSFVSFCHLFMAYSSSFTHCFPYFST
jgi:hypothetical protein